MQISRPLLFNPPTYIGSPGTLTIQPMPNRSASMPKRGDQNVFAIGMRTSPPLDNAAKIRSASASVAAEIARGYMARRVALQSHAGYETGKCPSARFIVRFMDRSPM